VIATDSELVVFIADYQRALDGIHRDRILGHIRSGESRSRLSRRSLGARVPMDNRKYGCHNRIEFDRCSHPVVDVNRM
jgi:hypothetical protein